MPATNPILNVPNVLTTVRFVLAIVVFVLIPVEQYIAATIVFSVAAGTDWIDGWWARKYNLVTKLGRIFDPFVDKIIICGAFIFLAAVPESGIAPWMAVLVMGREMLVTAVRGFIEQHGGDFSAKMSGKLKMVFQCGAVVLSLLVCADSRFSGPDPGPELIAFIIGAIASKLPWLLTTFVWLAIISTVWSGLEYMLAAARALRQEK
jgi:CDP-diacylglycerol--glycerol-3-phosphate 3-phosphatidyltransferase